jgi:hypothetical protein
VAFNSVFQVFLTILVVSGGFPAFLVVTGSFPACLLEKTTLFGTGIPCRLSGIRISQSQNQDKVVRVTVHHCSYWFGHCSYRFSVFSYPFIVFSNSFSLFFSPVQSLS